MHALYSLHGLFRASHRYQKNHKQQPAICKYWTLDSRVWNSSRVWNLNITLTHSVRLGKHTWIHRQRKCIQFISSLCIQFISSLRICAQYRQEATLEKATTIPVWTARICMLRRTNHRKSWWKITAGCSRIGAWTSDGWSARGWSTPSSYRRLDYGLKQGDLELHCRR